MSRTIHGLSHKAIAAFRSKPAALAVYWIYVSRMNNEGVAWPSGASLAKTTDWNKGACLDGRGFLVAHEALERIEGYIRPEWRKLDEKTLKRRLTLDRSEYYRPTGFIMLPKGSGSDEKQKCWLLYNGGDEVSDIDESTDDGQRRRLSSAPSVVGDGSRPDSPELDSSIQPDSNLQLDSIHSSSQNEISNSKNLENAPIKFSDLLMPDFDVVPDLEPVAVTVAPDDAKKWTVAYSQLEIQLDKGSFETWLRGTQLIAVEGSVWRFIAKTQFAADMLQHRLYREVRRVLSDVLGVKHDQIELQFQVAERIPHDESQ